MDPAECLEILSRSAAVHAASREGGNSVGCGCCAEGYPNQQGGEALVNALLGQGLDPEVVAEAAEAEGPPPPPPPPLPPRGQVIDLETGENELSAASLAKLFPALLELPADAADAAPESEAAEAAAGDEAKSDEQALGQRTEQLKGAAPAELVREVVRLHEQRVGIHKAYDAAFLHLMNAPGGGIEAIARTYPFVVGCATARFASLSRGVRAAAGLLEAVSSSESPPALPATTDAAKEAAGLIRKVQRFEQDRLQLVAASHLEQTRLWAATRSRPDKDNEEENQTLRMTRSSCADIKKKLDKASEEIEEAISELRYCAADLQDED